MDLTDPITGQPITAADLRAEIVRLEALALRQRTEVLEEIMLELIWRRERLLEKVETQNVD